MHAGRVYMTGIQRATMSAPEVNPYLCNQPTTYSEYDENLLIPAIPAPPTTTVALSAGAGMALELGMHPHGHLAHARHLYDTKLKENEKNEMPMPLGVFDHIMAEAIKKCVKEWPKTQKNLMTLVCRINSSSAEDSKAAYTTWLADPNCDRYLYLLNKTYTPGTMQVKEKVKEKDVRTADIMGEIFNSTFDVVHLREVFEKHSHQIIQQQNKVNVPVLVAPGVMEAYNGRKEITREANERKNAHDMGTSDSQGFVHNSQRNIDPRLMDAYKSREEETRERNANANIRRAALAEAARLQGESHVSVSVHSTHGSSAGAEDIHTAEEYARNNNHHYLKPEHPPQPGSDDGNPHPAPHRFPVNNDVTSTHSMH